MVAQRDQGEHNLARDDGIVKLSQGDGYVLAKIFCGLLIACARSFKNMAARAPSAAR